MANNDPITTEFTRGLARGKAHTRRIRARSRTLLLAGVTALGLSSPALAQEDTGSARDTARSYDTISPGGVSYLTGAFTYKLPLVSIGSGEFPRSLNYGLWYNSGSARFPNQPWTHNLTVRTSRTLIDDPAATMPEPDGKAHPEWQTWQYNVVLGQRSESFDKYDAQQSVGSYLPATKTGSTLTFTSTATDRGYHTFTGGRGEIVQFRTVGNSLAPGHADVWTEPDGARLKFGYSTSGSRTIESNLGYAVLMEAPVLVTAGIYDQEICVLNLTQYYLPSITACPTTAPTAKVRFTSSTPAGYKEVSSATAPDGGVYNFTYAQSTRDGVTRRALSCIKQPGTSTCSVTNTYDTCDQRFDAAGEDPSWTGSRDRVIRQAYPGGEAVDYVYTGDLGCRTNTQVNATNAISATTSVKPNGITVDEVKDPLLRQSLFSWTGGNTDAFLPQPTLVASATNPEGDRTEYTYDARGNVTSVRKKAKPNTGLADIVTSATYPDTSCANRKTCNKPATTTDARGNITNYTYDPVHGGILTETGPAPTSTQPRPQTRYTYVQRYAQILNSTGSFVQAATPVWLPASKSFCKTGAAPCVSSDEVKTTYDYGPTTGANNLLLRGIVVDAGVLKLRTCYGYDSVGRKISETRPRAGLTSCP